MNVKYEHLIVAGLVVGSLFIFFTAMGTWLDKSAGFTIKCAPSNLPTTSDMFCLWDDGSAGYAATTFRIGPK